jgi:hypothetical protein
VQLAVPKDEQTKSKGKSGDVQRVMSHLSGDGTTHIVHLCGTSHKHEDSQSRSLALSRGQARLWPGVCLANAKHTPYHDVTWNVLLMSARCATAEHGRRIESSLQVELVAMLLQNRCTHNLCSECSWSVSESPHIACYLKRI